MRIKIIFTKKICYTDLLDSIFALLLQMKATTHKFFLSRKFM
jgi:hypothetical protein